MRSLTKVGQFTNDHVLLREFIYGNMKEQRLLFQCITEEKNLIFVFNWIILPFLGNQKYFSNEMENELLKMATRQWIYLIFAFHLSTHLHFVNGMCCFVEVCVTRAHSKTVQIIFIKCSHHSIILTVRQKILSTVYLQ